MPETAVIRNTLSICPSCSAKIPASIVERDGAVYLDKRCAKDGDFSLLLSLHPDYYRRLDGYYFAVIDRSFVQRDYILHLTNRCELECPICLAEANRRMTADYPLKDLGEFLRSRKGVKIDIMGAEPAMREDLAEVIRVIRKSGNIPALHTNGIKIADMKYLVGLKKAGLGEVHLQFDGFDDEVYVKIRGRKLMDVKKKALDNLEALGIATDLVVTVVKGVNEAETGKVLDYASAHAFVKEVFFLGCRYLGCAKGLPMSGCLMPDEVIDIVEKETSGLIDRRDVFRFQKLYFALLSAFSVRKCFYIQHFFVVRRKNGYAPFGDVFDLKGTEKRLDRYRRLRTSGSVMAKPYLMYALMRGMLRGNGLFWIWEFLSYGLPFIRGFGLAGLPRKSVLIGFISACDTYSLDYDIAKNCGKGAISVELGVQESGAIDNVLRDNFMKGNTA
ncbi:MAG: radical SAM protein [Candidatus Omnitrophota bacterium]